MVFIKVESFRLGSKYTKNDNIAAYLKKKKIENKILWKKNCRCRICENIMKSNFFAISDIKLYNCYNLIVLSNPANLWDTPASSSRWPSFDNTLQHHHTNKSIYRIVNSVITVYFYVKGYVRKIQVCIIKRTS